MGYRGIRFLYFSESNSRAKAHSDRPEDSSDANRKSNSRANRRRLKRSIQGFGFSICAAYWNNVKLSSQNNKTWAQQMGKWLINGEESLKFTAHALKDKVEKIPEDKQCEPEPYIAVPAIQQISYCYDSEELRELYANLLASSMNTDKKGAVHPSFVDIIKQLTPDEAKILANMPRFSAQNMPLVDITRQFVNGGLQVHARNIVSPGFYSLCEHPENMSSYIENFKRLQLIDVPSHRSLSDESHYTEIIESDLVKSLQAEQLPPQMEYRIDKKAFNVTDYGIGFIQTCVDG